MNGDWQNIFHKRAKMFTARRFDRAGQIEAPTNTASAGRPPALSRFSIRLAFASNRSDRPVKIKPPTMPALRRNVNQCCPNQSKSFMAACISYIDPVCSHL